MTSLSVVWSVMAPFAMMAIGTAPQIDTPDPSPPTAIEQALVERACSNVASGRTFETDPHAQCLAAQLVWLRNDFGRDLRRLSASERSMLDSSCSRVQTSQGREAYLDCITGQLTALRNRRNRAKGAAAEPPPVTAPLANTAPPDTTSAQRASSPTAMIIGGVLLTIAAIAAGALALLRNRRQRTCCECGAAVPDSGDLCSDCRRSAAEEVRRVATERLTQERAADEQQRKLRAQEEEQRRRAARKEEEARLRVLEDARQREETRRREEQARRQAEDALRRSQVAAVESRPVEEFDPYVVLGVPRDTTRERIRAAYEEAKTKYDHENVAHLGVDIQDYYHAKAEAVDRAYQMLAG
jgi:hypothetical protein